MDERFGAQKSMDILDLFDIKTSPLLMSKREVKSQHARFVVN